MSAPTPAPGDDRPREGYYPDPSIPGYVRYWNGASWVPGTSRPAPSDGEPLAAPAGIAPAPAPAPSPSPAPASVEETGPVFLDEEPERYADEPVTSEPVTPEPAAAWQADASHQSGFGGDQDRRVSWGTDPRVPAPKETPTDGTVAIRAVKPEPKQPPSDGTVTFRRPTAPAADRPEGTMMMRAIPATPQVPGQKGQAAQGQAPQGPALQGGPAQAQHPQAQPQAAHPQPQAAHPQQAAPQPHAPQAAVPPQAAAPAQAGPGAGSPSWAQQVHHLAQPGQPGQPGQPAQAGQPAQPAPAQPAEPDGPVTPWKPVANDPFLAAAQAQASARPAGIGKRLAARLVDTVVLGAVTALAAVPLGTKAVDHINAKIDAAKASGHEVTVWLLDGTTSVYFGIILAVLLIGGVLYEALPTAKWGRTLGKKLCGIEVRDIEEHAAPTFGAAVKRWLVYSVPGLLAVGVVGVLWCLFDRPWHQCWHDKAARTFVAG
ncbi:RDD family protein [Streptomyces sp. NPDC046821]|uniref:RDD family protein n=1 Tax=Streptomyces sp. NPDC046821 TaxID=3154702 RepID=UPI0033E4112C